MILSMAQNIMVSAIILEFLQSFEFTDALLQMGQVVNVTLEDGKGKESSKSQFSPQIILHKGDKRKGIYNLSSTSVKDQSTVSVSDKDNQMIKDDSNDETQHTIWRTQTMQAPDLNKTRGKGDFMYFVH